MQEEVTGANLLESLVSKAREQLVLRTASLLTT